MDTKNKKSADNRVAVIVAGGIGRRMNTGIPKQFQLLRGIPLLMHTVRRFYDYDSTIEIRIVLPDELTGTWKELCAKHDFSVPHRIFPGGKTRSHSVRNGLTGLEPGLVVAVHDGVRPLVSSATLERCYQLAAEKGSAIPVFALTDSIREIRKNSSVARERNRYRTVQTPQVFRSEWIIEAYDSVSEGSFTDDATVVENRGFPIYLTEGNEENIKITTPKDLRIAEVLFDLVQ